MLLPKADVHASTPSADMSRAVQDTANFLIAKPAVYLMSTHDQAQHGKSCKQH